MTTAVTIEVPPLRGRPISYVTPGNTYVLHIHSGLRVVGIEEVPLPAGAAPDRDKERQRP